MPIRACQTCGALSSGSYCPRHQPKPRTARGSGGRRATFRRRTLALTGGRCAVASCRTPLDRVEVHHIQALADGGDRNALGIPLCHAHHAQATTRERKRARAQRIRVSANWTSVP